MTNQENANDQIIETVDEDGNVVKFELIDIVEVDEIEYGLLLPIEDENEEDDEENEVVLMRLKKEGEEFVFEAIEDDEEFEKVVAYIETQEEVEEDEE